MVTMNISLPEEMRAFVEAQVAKGGYASASEYMCEILLQAKHASYHINSKADLERKLLEGLASPATPMTSEDWNYLKRNLQKLENEKNQTAS